MSDKNSFAKNHMYIKYPNVLFSDHVSIYYPEIRDHVITAHGLDQGEVTLPAFMNFWKCSNCCDDKTFKKGRHSFWAVPYNGVYLRDHS